MQGKTAERHTSAEFVGFLEQVVSGCKPHQEIHRSISRQSVLRTQDQPGRRLPHSKQPREVITPSAPTYSSWLNQVEDLVRTAGARGHRSRHFHLGPRSLAQTPCATSVPYYSKIARPFKWEVLRRFERESSHARTNSLRRATSCYYPWRQGPLFSRPAPQMPPWAREMKPYPGKTLY